MTNLSARQPLLSALAGVTRDYATLMQRAVNDIRPILEAHDDANGVLLRRNALPITAQAGAILQRVFVVNENQSFGFGNMARTPFADMLNRHMAEVTYRAIQTHTRYLKATLPDDVYRRLAAAPVPIRAITSEQGDDERRRFMERWAHLRLFNPNPLARYEPMHTWVDPNGYQLSGRIWQTGLNTRARMDRAINDAINQGWSSQRLARYMEQFLRPDRANVRTKKPYGQDGSADAMRLARSEITRANSHAHLISARLNPYVGKWIFRLSGSHKQPDICDQLASQSPYDINGFCPVAVQDTHPYCLCDSFGATTATPQQVTADLRQALDEAAPLGIQPAVNPTNPTGLLAALIGQTLAGWYLREIGEWLGAQQ